jgi:predicted ATPase
VIQVLSTTNAVFSIQQPEVHLHPKAQAAFGSFVFNSYQLNKNQFIIETHSDYTINRFRYELKTAKNKSVTNGDCQVLFFERDGTESKVTSLPITSNGTFLNPAPDSYRDFFIDEELKLLEI